MTNATVLRPKVAVCLAAYNGLAYLPEQMDSILAQAGVDVSVFVSVDCSSDGTEDWFTRLQRDDHRVHLLPTGHRFGGAARNFFHLVRSVDFSGFDYAAFADQDDIWLPGKLKRAHERLCSMQADGYSSDIYAFWPSQRCCYIKKSYPQRRWDYLFESAGPGCTFVLKQQLVLRLQDFLQQHEHRTHDIGLHDWFTYAFARAHGYRWIIDEQATLLYRQHAHNQVGVNAGWAAFFWRARRVLAGWGLQQARLIAQLIGQAGQPFVQDWATGSRWGLLTLAWQGRHCRRKPLERVWFTCSCLALAVIGWKWK